MISFLSMKKLKCPYYPYFSNTNSRYLDLTYLNCLSQSENLVPD